MNDADYAGIVYDLDGTLVRLRVDWDAVTDDVVARYEAAGLTADERDLWELLHRAPEHGLGDVVEETIASHEREGARRSERLPIADELAGFDGPAAVCSLNAEDACRIALETHGLDDAVDSVIGRDTVSKLKPEPEPLLAAVEGIGVSPSAALFVGDSDSDRVAAERAGLDFRWA